MVDTKRCAGTTHSICFGSEWQRVLSKSKFAHDLSADEVFLNDSFENRRRAGVIPSTFRIHDGDRAAAANSQAIRFRAIDQRVWSDESEFLEPPLQVIPRFQAGFARAALGFSWIGTQEDVAPEGMEAQRCNGFSQF